MSELKKLKQRLRPGSVYRRYELARWSNAVDRHLKQLIQEGSLTKLSVGLYAVPRTTAFGNAPAEDRKLVESFLKDRRFLLTSPNAYNCLGVGTTQLYNQTVVYNHKRRGQFALGGRSFDFRVKSAFPRKLSPEFLLVDLVNNLDRLAESKEQILTRVRKRATLCQPRQLRRAVRDYGSPQTRRFFARALEL